MYDYTNLLKYHQLLFIFYVNNMFYELVVNNNINVNRNINCYIIYIIYTNIYDTLI